MGGLDIGEERNFFLVTIIQSRFLSCPALTLVTVLSFIGTGWRLGDPLSERFYCVIENAASRS
jgi:hypothetical protein